MRVVQRRGKKKTGRLSTPRFQGSRWNEGLLLGRAARARGRGPAARLVGRVGRVVQEVLYAAYASAGQGKKIALPFRPKGVKRPIDLWKNP
jgi:hypothetical protein